MKTHRKNRGRIAGAGVALVLAIAAAHALTRSDGVAQHAVQRARPLEREVVDLAVACIGAGEVRPAVAELSDSELECIVELVGRLISAYGRADFDSFLALRAADAGFAAGAQLERVEELRAFCLELGVPRAELPGDWIGLLRAYWNAYYVEAPVARFLPECSVIELRQEGLDPGALEAWEGSFDEQFETRTGSRLRHRLAIPHRRTIRRVAADAEGLAWVDLQLGFEAHDGNPGWLIARFVWDGALQEWFLHRATTILDGELRDDRRHLVL